MTNCVKDLIVAVEKLSAFPGISDWAGEDRILTSQSVNAPVEEHQDLVDILSAVEADLPDLVLEEGYLIMPGVKKLLAGKGIRLQHLDAGSFEPYKFVLVTDLFSILF